MSAIKNLVEKAVGAWFDTEEGKEMLKKTVNYIFSHKMSTAVIGLGLLGGYYWWEGRKSKRKIKEIKQKEESQINVLREKKETSIAINNNWHANYMERHQGRKEQKADQPETPKAPEAMVTISNDDIRQAAQKPKAGLIAEHLQRRQINMLYGLEGSGKTLLANHWAIQHCQDRQTAYTIYLDTEPDIGALHERYLARGYSFPANFRRVNALQSCPDIGTMVATIERLTAEAVEQLGRTDVLIVVDNLSSPPYQLDRSQPAAKLCDALTSLIARWPQPVSITVLLMMHVKLRKNGTIEDADVNKYIARTAHGPAYRLAQFSKSCYSLTAPMDNNGVTPGDQLLTIVDKPYLHHEASSDTDIHRVMPSEELTATIRQMYNKGMRQADIARALGINRQNVHNRLQGDPGRKAKERRKAKAKKQLNTKAKNS